MNGTSYPAFTPQPQSIIALWPALLSRPAEGRRLRWYDRPKTVTHPSTNRARRRVTSLIRPRPLAPRQTACDSPFTTWLLPLTFSASVTSFIKDVDTSCGCGASTSTVPTDAAAAETETGRSSAGDDDDGGGGNASPRNMYIDRRNGSMSTPRDAHKPTTIDSDRCRTCDFIARFCRATLSRDKIASVTMRVAQLFNSRATSLFRTDQRSILCNLVARML